MSARLEDASRSKLLRPLAGNQDDQTKYLFEPNVCLHQTVSGNVALRHDGKPLRRSQDCQMSGARLERRDSAGKMVSILLPPFATAGQLPLLDNVGQQDKISKFTAMIRQVGVETMCMTKVENHRDRGSTTFGAKAKAGPSAGVSVSSLANVLVSLIKVVQDVSQEDAIQIAWRRCVQIQADERCPVLQSEATSDIMERKDLDLHDCEAHPLSISKDTLKDLLVVLASMLKKVPASADLPFGAFVIEDMEPSDMHKHFHVAAEWPSGEFGIKDVHCLCPTGASLRADFSQQRYQITYKGGTCSRAWRRHGHAESLRLVVKWAWEQHTVRTGIECHVKGIFPPPIIEGHSAPDEHSVGGSSAAANTSFQRILRARQSKANIF